MPPPSPHGLASPPEHQFGVLGHVLLHQVVEQRLQDVREVLQLAVQGHGQQGRHVGPVPRGEGPLDLQRVNELGTRRRGDERLPATGTSM